MGLPGSHGTRCLPAQVSQWEDALFSSAGSTQPPKLLQNEKNTQGHEPKNNPEQQRNPRFRRLALKHSALILIHQIARWEGSQRSARTQPASARGSLVFFCSPTLTWSHVQPYLFHEHLLWDKGSHFALRKTALHMLISFNCYGST